MILRTEHRALDELGTRALFLSVVSSILAVALIGEVFRLVAGPPLGVVPDRALGIVARVPGLRPRTRLWPRTTLRPGSAAKG
jgi:hypothetical protein